MVKWLSVRLQSGCGFESHCSHLNFLFLLEISSDLKSFLNFQPRKKGFHLQKIEMLQKEEKHKG